MVDHTTPDNCPWAAIPDHDRTGLELLSLLNRERDKRGLPTLSPHPDLAGAALAHARDMAATNKLDEYGSRDRSTCQERCRRAGYQRPVAEVVAAGQTAVQQVLADWLRSPAHRGVVLHRRAVSVGCASATGSRGWTYWCATVGLR